MTRQEGDRDTSDRARGGEALEVTRGRLSKLLESAGDFIAMMDTSFRFTVFNTAFHDEIQKIFGVSLRPGDSLLTALAHQPEDLAHARGYWARALEGEDFTVEHQFGDPELGRYWYEFRFSPIRDADGAVSGAMHVVRNVTERKALEVRLQQILREREIILDTANVGLSLVVDRKQVWVNRWVEETFQRTSDEIVGESTRIFYPSTEAYDQLGQAAYPVLSRGEVFESVQELVRKDGRHVWISYNGKAIDPNDLSKGVLWILNDVTHRKEADDRLRESEARFRSMFESHSAVMLLVDPQDGRIVDANPAACKFYGYTRERLWTMGIADINTAPGEVVRADFASAAVRRKNTFMFEHRLASGELRTVEVNSSPTEVLGRRMLFSIIFDVTDRVRLERELAQRQRDLEALNESLEKRVEDAVTQLRAKDRILIAQNRQAAMGEMIGNIAHQWRQPLNTLSLILANMKDADEYGQLDSAELHRLISRGNAIIQRMSSTINDFWNFFRPSKQPRLFSILQQVRDTVALVDTSFRARDIAIDIEAPEDVHVHGYPNEYAQVLLNLLSNASHAIAERGEGAGLIRVRLAREADQACLSVSDNGGGIPEAHLDRIFEPYFSTRPSGTGVGLYMSRQIIEGSMKGRISAGNVEGGAELVVRVPLGGQPSTAAAAP